MAETKPIMVGVPEEGVGRRKKYVAQSEMFIYWIIWQNLPKVGKSCKKFAKIMKSYQRLEKFTNSYQKLAKYTKIHQKLLKMKKITKSNQYLPIISKIWQN